MQKYNQYVKMQVIEKAKKKREKEMNLPNRTRFLINSASASNKCLQYAKILCCSKRNKREKQR